MTLEGSFDPSDLIRTFIEREYAFSIAYDNGIELRIGHHKGTWFVGRLQEKKLVGLFEYNDADDVSVLTTQDTLFKSLAEAVRDAEIKQSNAVFEDGRRFPAIVLEKVFRITGGTPETITRISVVQSDRNARIDEVTGEFILSRR